MLEVESPVDFPLRVPDVTYPVRWSASGPVSGPVFGPVSGPVSGLVSGPVSNPRLRAILTTLLAEFQRLEIPSCRDFLRDLLDSPDIIRRPHRDEWRDQNTFVSKDGVVYLDWTEYVGGDCGEADAVLTLHHPVLGLRVDHQNLAGAGTTTRLLGMTTVEFDEPGPNTGANNADDDAGAGTGAGTTKRKIQLTVATDRARDRILEYMVSHDGDGDDDHDHYNRDGDVFRYKHDVGTGCTVLSCRDPPSGVIRSLVGGLLRGGLGLCLGEEANCDDHEEIIFYGCPRYTFTFLLPRNSDGPLDYVDYGRRRSQSRRILKVNREVGPKRDHVVVALDEQGPRVTVSVTHPTTGKIMETEVLVDLPRWTARQRVYHKGICVLDLSLRYDSGVTVDGFNRVTREVCGDLLTRFGISVPPGDVPGYPIWVELVARRPGPYTEEPDHLVVVYSQSGLTIPSSLVGPTDCFGRRDDVSQEVYTHSLSLPSFTTVRLGSNGSRDLILHDESWNEVGVIHSDRSAPWIPGTAWVDSDTGVTSISWGTSRVTFTRHRHLEPDARCSPDGWCSLLVDPKPTYRGRFDGVLSRDGKEVSSFSVVDSVGEVSITTDVTRLYPKDRLGTGEGNKWFLAGVLSTWGLYRDSRQYGRDTLTELADASEDRIHEMGRNLYEANSYLNIFHRNVTHVDPDGGIRYTSVPYDSAQVIASMVEDLLDLKGRLRGLDPVVYYDLFVTRYTPSTPSAVFDCVVVPLLHGLVTSLEAFPVATKFEADSDLRNLIWMEQFPKTPLAMLNGLIDTETRTVAVPVLGPHARMEGTLTCRRDIITEYGLLKTIRSLLCCRCGTDQPDEVVHTDVHTFDANLRSDRHHLDRDHRLSVGTQIGMRERKEMIYGYKIGVDEKGRDCVIQLEIPPDAQVATCRSWAKHKASKIRVVWIRPFTVQGDTIIHQFDRGDELCGMCETKIGTCVLTPCQHRICPSCWLDATRFNVAQTAKCVVCRRRVEGMRYVNTAGASRLLTYDRGDRKGPVPAPTPTSDEKLEQALVDQRSVVRACSAVSPDPFTYEFGKTYEVKDFDARDQGCRGPGFYFHLTERDILRWLEFTPSSLANAMGMSSADWFRRFPTSLPVSTSALPSISALVPTLPAPAPVPLLGPVPVPTSVPTPVPTPVPAPVLSWLSLTDPNPDPVPEEGSPVTFHSDEDQPHWMTAVPCPEKN